MPHYPCRIWRCCGAPRRAGFRGVTSAARAASACGKGSPASHADSSAPPSLACAACHSSSGGSTRVAGAACGSRQASSTASLGQAQRTHRLLALRHHPGQLRQPASRQPLRPAGLPRCRWPPARRARTAIARSPAPRRGLRRAWPGRPSAPAAAAPARAAPAPADRRTPPARSCGRQRRQLLRLRLHEGLVAAVAAPRTLEDDDGGVGLQRPAQRAPAAAARSRAAPRPVSLATRACTRPKRPQASARASNAEPSTPPPPTTSSTSARAADRRGPKRRRAALASRHPWRRTVRTARQDRARTLAWRVLSGLSRGSIRPRTA